jgi:RNA polymerase sigma-70 factor (ECF subfamily)
VQDAYLRAFKGFSGYAGGDPRSWLLAIVRNACYTAMRRRAAMDNVIVFSDAIDRLEAADQSAGSQPDRRLESKEAASLLNAALAALQPIHREVLVLREIEELSYREIAQVLGLPAGTVMSRLARARALLADALDAPPSRAKERG